MTALRQEAMQMVETMPEENLAAIVNFMAKFRDNAEQINRRNRKAAAFANLERLRREVPDLDYEQALAEYREEKYGTQNLH